MFNFRGNTAKKNPVFDTIGDRTIEVMKLLLLTLLGLSVLTHVIMVCGFPNTLDLQSYCVAFIPVYITLSVSFLFLQAGKIKLSTHMFLLGMIITQMLVVVFLTGPAAYVFVSYTNVVLVAGLILGPASGAMYTLIIVMSVSLYFYVASLGLVDTDLLQDIEHGSDMALIAMIACFIFTGVSVSYFVLKMARLYTSILEEKEKSNQTLKVLETLQKTNEDRAKQGASIGWLGQKLVQIERSQLFMKVASEEILRVLSVDLVLIVVADVEGYTVKSVSAPSENEMICKLFLERNINVSKKIWKKQIQSDRPDGLFLEKLIPEDACVYREMKNISSVQLLDAENNLGSIMVFSHRESTEQQNFLTAVSSLLSSALCRESAEDNLRQFQKMETLGLLAGGIAHDFNNLLMTIVGNTDVALRKPAISSELIHLLQQISWASNQATSLTHKLLTFSKKSSLSPERININTVLKEMLPIIQQAFFGHVELEICYSSQPAWIEIDRRDFETALLNLILNAKEAIEDHGTVWISVSQLTSSSSNAETPKIRLQVKDNGCGIEPVILSKVFEPFFTTKLTGTGLGLTMVRSVIERASGELTVESTANGTVFNLDFPKQFPIQVKEFPDNYSQHSDVSKRTESVLVVEDDFLVRLALVEMLEEGGYQTIQAEGVSSALQKLGEQKVDIVLSDINMPGKSGSELYQHVSTQFPDIPIVFMTGYSPKVEEPIPILEKPISLQELLRTIDDCLSLSRQNIEKRQMRLSI